MSNYNKESILNSDYFWEEYRIDLFKIKIWFIYL